MEAHHPSHPAPAESIPVSDTARTENVVAPESAPGNPQTASAFGSGAENTSHFPPPPKREVHPIPPAVATGTTTSDPVSRPADGGSHHTGPSLVQKAKGLVAQGHGLGESLRGNINSGIDAAFNDKEGMKRDEAIAGKGKKEVLDAEFVHDKTPRKLQH